MKLPWQELVDSGIVVVVVPNPEEALDVELDGHPVLGRINALDLSNAHVSQVLDDPELVVQQLAHLQVVQLLNRREGLVIPIEILDLSRGNSLKNQHFVSLKKMAR